MKCQFYSKEFNEEDIQEHHIHPRFMNNKNGDGKKVYLCEKCHNILHLIIPSLIWIFIKEEDKPKIINLIKKFTEDSIK